MKIKEDHDTSVVLDKSIINITGKQADAFRLMSFSVESSKLVSLRNRIQVTPFLISKIISDHVYSRIRSDPLECNALVGGLNESNTLELFCIDRYGCRHADNFCVTGYGLYFLFGIFDSMYSETMDSDAAIELIRSCLKVLKEKLIIETDNWNLNIIGLDELRNETLKL